MLLSNNLSFKINYYEQTAVFSWIFTFIIVDRFTETCNVAVCLQEGSFSLAETPESKHTKGQKFIFLHNNYKIYEYTERKCSLCSIINTLWTIQLWHFLSSCFEMKGHEHLSVLF